MGRLIAFLAGLVSLITALLWFLRKKQFRPRKVFVREIDVVHKKGTCAIEREPEDVELCQSAGDEVHWVITHRGEAPCPEQVRVCVGLWKRNGVPSQEPTIDLGHGQHCRPVRRNHPSKTIKGKAKPPGQAPEGDYYYQVLINGQPVADPIVRLVI